jgi:hypothetical protein
MDGVSGPRGYAASVSILRRASDTAKSENGGTISGEARVASEQPEITVEGGADGSAEDAAAAASGNQRPIGNVGQHLDLRL